MTRDVASPRSETQSRPAPNGRTSDELAAAQRRERIPVRKMGIADAAVIAVALLSANLLRFGATQPELTVGSHRASYWLVSVGLAITWYIFLTAANSRDPRFFGTGIEEYRRAVSATFYFFGFIAILSYAFNIPTARGYVATALPVGLVLLLTARWLLRQRLNKQRRSGRHASKTVVLGSPSAVAHLHSVLAAKPEAGFKPVAAILPSYQLTSPTGEELPIPVVSVSTDVNDIVDAVHAADAVSVTVSSGSALKPRQLRELGWRLQDHGIGLILAPALTDIAGPRLHTVPVAGLPLIHVSTPRLTGAEATAKRLFDVLGAGALVALLAPILLSVAVLVKLSSTGPILYSQQRIGQNGEPFAMFKFRSMVDNADDQLRQLLLAQGREGQPLFKVENDPRITSVGRYLRRYSLDELPQLFNVLNGTMSLVGPRPQREDEVALYTDSAYRRLLVRPGMSGLWQVSGRSSLSWEEALRLDLYYVENWSLSGDFVILLKTVRAVIAPEGAV